MSSQSVDQTGGQNIGPIPPSPQLAPKPVGKLSRTLILLNAIPAAALYVTSLVAALFVLGYSSQGDIPGVIAGTITVFGAFVFTPVALADVIILLVLRRRGRKISLSKHNLKPLVLIWGPLLVSVVFYGINFATTGYTYKGSHYPSQSKAIAMIKACQVSSIEQDADTDGDTAIMLAKPDASEGGVYTNANWSSLVGAVKSARKTCPNRVDYTNKTTVYTWLTQKEAIDMISQCKVSLVADDTVLSDSNGNYYFNLNDVKSSDRPKGPETGYLLENPGSYATLTADYSTVKNITSVTNQYKNSCKMDANI